MKILSKIIVLLAIVAIVLETGNIYLSNIQAVGSISASKQQVAISQVSEENGNLATEVMQLSSLETVSSRAAGLGFVEAKEVISLATPQQLAFKK